MPRPKPSQSTGESVTLYPCPECGDVIERCDHVGPRQGVEYVRADHSRSDEPLRRALSDVRVVAGDLDVTREQALREIEAICDRALATTKRPPAGHRNAVERVADVIERFMVTDHTWSTREFAEAVLRAAGEAER